MKNDFDIDGYVEDTVYLPEKRLSANSLGRDRAKALLILAQLSTGMSETPPSFKPARGILRRRTSYQD